MTEVLDKYVHPETYIITDGFSSYVPATRGRFQHRTVNHSETFVSEEGIHTNEIENLWRQIKRFYKERNGIVRNRFEEFLIEVSGKYSVVSPRTRESDSKGFEDIINRL